MKSKRESELAEFGEARTCDLLRREGFEVERMPKNFHFFAPMAKRGSRRLLVPVKTRDNTTSKGTIKADAYNLFTDMDQSGLSIRRSGAAHARVEPIK